MKENGAALVIELRGDSGSGKSTASAYLARRHGYVVRAFGAHVRNKLARAIASRETPVNLPHRWLAVMLSVLPVSLITYVLYRKPTPRYVREWLQFFGHDHGRALDENVWVEEEFEALEREGLVTPFGDATTNLIYDDSRYANEGGLCDIVSRRRTLRIKIVKPGVRGKLHLHASENQKLTAPDLVIVASTPERLYALLDIARAAHSADWSFKSIQRVLDMGAD